MGEQQGTSKHGAQLRVWEAVSAQLASNTAVPRWGHDSSLVARSWFQSAKCLCRCVALWLCEVDEGGWAVQLLSLYGHLDSTREQAKGRTGTKRERERK